jgi:hypothetical protein
MTFLAIPIFVGTVALAACYLPGRRAVSLARSKHSGTNSAAIYSV